MSEFERASLRANNTALADEIQRRDLEALHREALECQAREEVARELAAAKLREDAEAEMEEHRRRMWTNHHGNVAAEFAAKGDTAGLIEFGTKPINIPLNGWPPGTSPEDFKGVAAWAPAEPELGEGILAQAMKNAQGLKL